MDVEPCPISSSNPQLAADSVPVTSLALSDLRLMNDARFPWLLLVPRRADMAEIIDLEKADRARLFEEIVTVSTALKAATACDKLNVAALGNSVPPAARPHHRPLSRRCRLARAGLGRRRGGCL